VPSSSPRLERKDDTIRLTGEKMSQEAMEQYVNPLIQQRMQMLVQEGWEADGTVDLMMLWRQGRLACREHASFWLEAHTYSPTSVTVRVRRIATA
jgi:hypothetical protein